MHNAQEGVDGNEGETGLGWAQSGSSPGKGQFSRRLEKFSEGPKALLQGAGSFIPCPFWRTNQTEKPKPLASKHRTCATTHQRKRKLPEPLLQKIPLPVLRRCALLFQQNFLASRCAWIVFGLRVARERLAEGAARGNGKCAERLRRG